MLDHDALRFAGRAGGIEDVAGAIGRDDRFAAGEGRIGQCGKLGLDVVDQKVTDRKALRLFPVRRCRNDERQPRILDDEGNSLLGKRNRQRNVGRTGLKDGQHGDIGIGRAIEQQSNTVAAANAARDQQSGEAIGPGIDLIVGPAEPPANTAGLEP